MPQAASAQIAPAITANVQIGNANACEREPNDADGPLIGAAVRRAIKIDNASTPEQRRKAWLPIGFGATAGNVSWAVPLVVSGVVGTVLVSWSVAKHWTFGRQWAVLLGVQLVQITLMIAPWKSG